MCGIMEGIYGLYGIVVGICIWYIGFDDFLVIFGIYPTTVIELADSDDDVTMRFKDLECFYKEGGDCIWSVFVEVR